MIYINWNFFLIKFFDFIFKNIMKKSNENIKSIYQILVMGQGLYKLVEVEYLVVNFGLEFLFKFVDRYY